MMVILVIGYLLCFLCATWGLMSRLPLSVTRSVQAVEFCARMIFCFFMYIWHNYEILSSDFLFPLLFGLNLMGRLF